MAIHTRTVLPNTKVPSPPNTHTHAHTPPLTVLQFILFLFLEPVKQNNTTASMSYWLLILFPVYAVFLCLPCPIKYWKLSVNVNLGLPYMLLYKFTCSLPWHCWSYGAIVCSKSLLYDMYTNVLQRGKFYHLVCYNANYHMFTSMTFLDVCCTCIT